MNNQPLNGYLAYYSNQTTRDTTEVFAHSLYEAKEEAVKKFAAKYPRRRVQSHQVTVQLAQLGGKPVVLEADF